MLHTCYAGPLTRPTYGARPPTRVCTEQLKSADEASSIANRLMAQLASPAVSQTLAQVRNRATWSPDAIFKQQTSPSMIAQMRGSLPGM